jgi:hypothetical protein
VTRPEAVVYIDVPRGHLRQEAAWAVRWLRRAFSTWIARDATELERRLEGGARIVVILSTTLPDALLPKLRLARSPARAIVIAPTEVRRGMILRGFPYEGTAWIETGQIRQSFPREVSIGLIQSLFTRCRSALGAFELFLGHAHLHETIKVALAPPPAKPFRSVEGMAAATHHSRLWLTLQWSRVFDAAGLPSPTLEELVRGVLFLRALTLWLSGNSLEECAAALDIGVGTLQVYFVQFLEHDASGVDLDDLPNRLLQLEEALFRWLLSAKGQGAIAGSDF